ncbi:MAG TPA: 2Fe-2S iron-sulfur cluster-binding protein [Steroidobacteraceae bacterium]|nr:2Fe-2S iron-sulfur cluster-binding protein [Steroidobacteraceae bacterium]
MRRFHSLTVGAVSPDADDAVAITLEVPAQLQGEYLGAAGQHVVVRTQIDGEEVRRTYSLVNAPGEWPLRIVPRVHAAGKMSRYLAEELRAGDTLDVLPPNGSFTARSSAARGGRYVAFAAGCGITPVLAVARTLLALPDKHVMLFYGNTGSARAMCLEELLALKDRYLERLSLHFVMSREPQEAPLYNGRIDGVRVRELAAALFRPLEIAEYFVCGPGDMIEQVGGALRALGVEASRIHAEHFSAATAGEPVAHAAAAAPAPAPAPAAPAHAPEAARAAVTIVMDGRRRSFTMPIGGETVLDAAARAGIELPFSCRAGVCSTCRTKVVRGEVEMAQNYALEDWELEQGYVLACQSHVRSATLELDYDEK